MKLINEKRKRLMQDINTGQMMKNRQKQAWIFSAKSKVDSWRFATDSQISKNS